MNVLPRLLYLLQAIPIKLPPSFFTSYKHMCRTFIWASKSLRLVWDRLILPKLLGGLGLPDIQKYHWACHLTRIVDWHVHSHTKDWIKLENATTDVPLAYLPWITHKTIPTDGSTHPLIGATLSCFARACTYLATTPSPCPMTPLDRNPQFYPRPCLSRHCR